MFYQYIRGTLPSKYARWLFSFLFSIVILLPTVVGALYQFQEAGFLDAKKQSVEAFLEIQNDNPNTSVVVNGFSRKQNLLLKLNLVASLDQYDIILFGNHQLQYVGENGLPEISQTLRFFNLWMGNLGITELADVIEYVEINYKKTLPSKILISMITTPNNDWGDCIVGYRDELPIAIAKPSLPPFDFLKMGSWVDNLEFTRVLRYSFDYKALLGLFKTGIERNFTFITNSPAGGDFGLNVLGASRFSASSDARGLVINDNQGEEISKISLDDVEEIVSSLSRIDRVAKRNAFLHVVVIPPVYETQDSARRHSIPNLVLNKALAEFSENSASSIVLDHRFITSMMENFGSDMFYHYDHPNSLYGEYLIREILKVSREGQM